MIKIFYKIFLPFVIFMCLLSSCDDEISVRAPEKPIPTGFYFIDSNPQGAGIYLDGRNTGYYTPDTLNWMEHREYQVTLKQDLFRDTTFFIIIYEGEINDTLIDYTSNQKMRGAISFLTVPSGASIYLEDELLDSVTPDTVHGLLPGVYSVKYFLDGFRHDSITAAVASNEITHAFSELTDTSLWVDYNRKTSQIHTQFLSCIFIDKNNKIWLGSDGVGLASFDRENWEKFNTVNSGLPGNKIDDISGYDNSLYIATDMGLAKYEGGFWSVWNSANSLIPSDSVTALAVENDGTLWVGTDDGIGRFSNNNWTIYNTNNTPLPNTKITSIAISPDNDKWFGLDNSGVIRLSGENWTLFRNSTQYNLLNNYVLTIAITGTGTVWMGHKRPNLSIGGYSKYEHDLWEDFESIIVGDINSLFIDNVGKIWAASEGGLITFTDPNNELVFTIENSGLMNNDIKDITQDKDGLFWIATNGGGLFKYKGN